MHRLSLTCSAVKTQWVLPVQRLCGVDYVNALAVTTPQLELGDFQLDIQFQILHSQSPRVTRLSLLKIDLSNCGPACGGFASSSSHTDDTSKYHETACMHAAILDPCIF